MGAKEDRNLITGLHTVADVYCNSCQTVLGWKYVSFLFSPFPLALLVVVRERPRPRGFSWSSHGDLSTHVAI